jgi:DNA-directed RNA polymerase subunit RPC12/RpoP
MNFNELAKLKFKCPECGSKRKVADWISRATVALEEIKPTTELVCFDCLSGV